MLIRSLHLSLKMPYDFVLILIFFSTAVVSKQVDRIFRIWYPTVFAFLKLTLLHEHFSIWVLSPHVLFFLLSLLLRNWKRDSLMIFDQNIPSFLRMICLVWNKAIWLLVTCIKSYFILMFNIQCKWYVCVTDKPLLIKTYSPCPISWKLKSRSKVKVMN